MKKMKKWWLAAAVSLAVFAGFGAGIAKAQPSPPVRDIGGEVRGVFATRCAGCHGPDLAKPKGRFGYVLNLRRIAANPEMVIPGRPTESELWILVQGDEMPPTDSPQGGSRRCKRKSFGPGSPLVPRTLPQVPWIPLLQSDQDRRPQHP